MRETQEGQIESRQPEVEPEGKRTASKLAEQASTPPSYWLGTQPRWGLILSLSLVSYLECHLALCANSIVLDYGPLCDHSPCHDDKNTAPMNISSKSKLSSKKRSFLKVQHFRNHWQTTTKEFGEEHGLTGSLISKAERDRWQSFSACFWRLHMSITRVNRVVGGIVTKEGQVAFHYLQPPMRPSKGYTIARETMACIID